MIFSKTSFLLIKDVYDVDSEDESSIDSSFMSDNESHFSELNRELDDITADANDLIFSRELNYINSQPNVFIDNQTRNLLENFLYEYQTYDYYDGFNLVIGSNRVLRVSCANHKLNLAIRRGISLCDELKSILVALNNANVQIRRSIKLNSMFRNKKCRLRCENATRWSSSYLLLESTKRAYDKNMFDEQLQCPVSKEKIELYLQILKPAYILSLKFQYHDSNIGDLIPCNYLFSFNYLSLYSFMHLF